MARPSGRAFFMLRCLLLLVISLLFSQCPGQTPFPPRNGSFIVAFYNTENLFDIIDDPLKNDNEFLPKSALNWDQQKYQRKLENTARVLASMDSTCPVGLIGLAEVENIQVLRDLLRKLPAWDSGFRILLEEGNDPRGIDVALLFNTKLLSLLSQKPFPTALRNPARPILYGKFLSPSRDTLHVFVNHWRSRGGGEKETAGDRMISARRLKGICDSLFTLDRSARIIILGDFNDNPTDPSLVAGLAAHPVQSRIQPSSLYNLMHGKFRNGEGTLYYRGWEMFDQVIVSGSLIKGKEKGTRIQPPEGMIFRKDWMMFKNSAGVMIPNRTAGKQYFGGYSDHLPVYVKVAY